MKLHGHARLELTDVHTGEVEVVESDNLITVSYTHLDVYKRQALAGITLAVGDAGPAPGTAGLWCKGVTVLEQRENLLGTVRRRCRVEFTPVSYTHQMCIRDSPWAYNAVYYDAARRTLVIFDELTRNRTPNRETAQLLVERGHTAGA